MFYDERETAHRRIGTRSTSPSSCSPATCTTASSIKITDNVWEFASGPHNSNNHWASDEGDRPPNGAFKYGPREVEIRWSTYYRSDIPRENLLHPNYCVVQVNNVFNNPIELGGERWVAFPRPQVIFQYFDGRTGRLKYAESVLATER